MIDAMYGVIDREVWGSAMAGPEPPPLTFEHLKAVHDYLKPEYLDVKGEKHEIFGFHVHQGGYVPKGKALLTRKQRPGEITPFAGFVLLDFDEGMAYVHKDLLP